MIETYYAAAYWGPRRESAEACARRARSFLHAMARCDPFFARWFGPPHSRKHPPRPLELEGSALEEMLSQGRTRNDDGGVIEDLGFHIFLDNGMWPGTRQREFAALRVACGSYADRVPNSCVLNLPSDEMVRKQIVRAPLLTNILRAMVLAWEPARCIATSHAHLDLVNVRGGIGTFVGWLMYLPRKLGPVPPLPPPVQVEPVDDKGSLVILTPERFTASNPEHMALAARVRDALSEAGLLKPLF